MSNYSITVKKGKFQLVLTSTDSEFVVSQFETWVQSAKKYAQKAKTNECKEIVNNQIKAEEEITKKNIEEQITKCTPKEEPEKSEPQKEKKSNEDLDIFYAPPVQPAQQAFEQTISDINEKNDAKPVFDNILEDSMNNPQTELKVKKNPSIQRDDRFIDYMCSKQINKKTDYLLLAAYYFAEYEGHPRFTIKQLNAKLMQNMAVIVDHAIIQEAVNRNYIECLPDLTGVVGASEYRLTSYGEKVLLDA